MMHNERNGVVHHTEAIHQASESFISSQEAKCVGQSATRVDGFVIPGNNFLNTWDHSLYNFSQHFRVHSNNIMEGSYIFILHLPHESIIVQWSSLLPKQGLIQFYQALSLHLLHLSISFLAKSTYCSWASS